MLASLLGHLGSGKTLLLTYLATKFKRPVYSNFKLNLVRYKPLKVIDLLNLPNNIEVFIDEGYTWLESRVSSKVLNRYLSYILLQSRKRTINIYITAQLFSTVDLRFRQQSDIIILCKKVENGFQYKILNTINNSFMNLLFPFKKAEKYYKFYDTYEIVQPYEKEKLEFSLLQSDTTALLNKSKIIANEIKDKIGKITHDNVKICLMENGFDKNYESYVYAFLKRDILINKKKNKNYIN